MNIVTALLIAVLPAQAPGCNDNESTIILTVRDSVRVEIGMDGTQKGDAERIDVAKGLEICVEHAPSAWLSSVPFRLSLIDAADTSAVTTLGSSNVSCPAPNDSEGRCVIRFAIGGRTPFKLRVGGEGIREVTFATVFGSAAGRASANDGLPLARRLALLTQHVLERTSAGTRLLASGRTMPTLNGANDGNDGDESHMTAQSSTLNGLGSHYDVDADTVSLWFDGQTGMLLGNSDRKWAPVNFDQNDRFRIHVLWLEGETPFRITGVTGEYAPSDLSSATVVRPTVTATSTSTHERVSETVVDYSILLGPFTSEEMSFTIEPEVVNKADSTVRKIEVKSRINPLHHIGYRFALVGSTLRNPEFEPADLPGGEARTVLRSAHRQVMPVFHVAFYSWWLGRRAASIPTGIDPVKDASKVRISPTLGVALDDPLDNIYAGAAIDIARGIGLTAGLHVGKIRRWKGAEGFHFGTDSYEGDPANLPIGERWKLAGFYGVTLDTRIIAQLIGGN